MCEPLLTHRNEITMASKLGSVGGPGTKARCGGPSVGELSVCGPGGARCIGGVSSSQALAWNRRTCRCDRDGRCFLAARGRTTSSGHCEWASTDAGHGGGPARSSGEGPVMGSEAKGPGSSRSFGGQRFGGGADRSTEAEVEVVRDSEASRLRGVEEGPSEQCSAGRGRCEHRRFRGRRGGQPLQAVESDVFGELFPRRPVRAVEIPKDHGAGVRVLGVGECGRPGGSDRGSDAGGRGA